MRKVQISFSIKLNVALCLIGVAAILHEVLS
jgi:hypothetical protein